MARISDQQDGQQQQQVQNSSFSGNINSNNCADGSKAKQSNAKHRRAQQSKAVARNYDWELGWVLWLGLVAWTCGWVDWLLSGFADGFLAGWVIGQVDRLLDWWIVCWVFSWLDELVVGSTDDVFLLARLRSRLVRCKECIAFVSAGCAALQHRTSAQNESACDESCCNEYTSCMSLPT